ncbi:MAG: hypothetical protein QGG88_08315 [Gammaproteobacteria bacterium]|jgi:hypothetical protein|nr:hypothetical protein [Gammaproteobacteria bacterium]
MQQALRLSRQQYVYAEILWQDMLAAYGDTNSPDYWRQRAQRRAYQGAIVQHLLQAAHSLAMAVLHQVVDLPTQQITASSLSDTLPLLQQQNYLSASAQLLQQALAGGYMEQLQTAQQVFDAGAGPAVTTATVDTGQSMAIGMVASDRLDDPDLWPVGHWLTAQQTLLEAVQAELQEC